MTGARTSTLARLQGQIERLESGLKEDVRRVPLGHPQVDAALQGGLIQGALHEVYAEGAQAASATGFVAAVARRLGEQKFLLWARADFSARENGELWMPGFAELGLDPGRIVLVRAKDAETVLRVVADALTCNVLGAVIGEIWGETRAFDLVASRKLTLAAAQSGVTPLLLRFAAKPQASTAETRWIVRAAHSPPGFDAWGAPVFATTLARNRHGPNGQWIMEWDCDACVFRESAENSLPLAAAPANRSHSAVASGRSDDGAVQRRQYAS